jgi:glycolate oxidase
MDEKLEKAIVDIVGEDHFTRNIIDLVSYACDASEHCNRPLCAVFAETTEQIAELMKLANREKIPITPRGAGTGLSGMAVPIRGRHHPGSFPHEQNPENQH